MYENAQWRPWQVSACPECYQYYEWRVQRGDRYTERERETKVEMSAVCLRCWKRMTSLTFPRDMGYEERYMTGVAEDVL